MDTVKSIRNNYLKQTDVYMLADFPLTDEKRSSIIYYRQQLRDLPSTIGDVEIDIANIGWYFPVSPITMSNPTF